MNKIKTYSGSSIPESCDVQIHIDGRVVETYFYYQHDPIPQEIDELEVGDFVRADIFPENEVWEVIDITHPGEFEDPSDKTAKQREETAGLAELHIAYVGNHPSRYDPDLVAAWRGKAGVVFTQRKIAGVKARLASAQT